RVVKSRPMPGGKTVERVIYEKQPPSSARSMGEPFIPPRGAYPVGELDAAPSCQSVEDYCNLASRITIRRLLWRYLDEANLTVSELLYCTTEATRIMKGDPLVAASIDRVAQLQARITGLDAKGRRDEIQTALDRVLLRTRNAEARLNNVGFVGHGLGELLAAAEACSSPESRNWVTLVALTNQLFGIRNMTQKLARVVYWSREADPQAMIVLDGLAADILGSQNVVHDLIGQKPNLGLHLCGVADLMRGELDAPGRTAPETAVELNRMIGENRLPATRVVLGERIIKNLKLNQPLSKNEPSAELELFRQLLDRLLLPGGMVGGFLMADALTERCLRVRNLGSKTGRQEALISVASTTMDCQRTAHYLLALVSPEGGRVWLADVVKAVEHIFLRASDVSTLTPPAMAPKDRLKALVTTFRLFQSSTGLPADTVKAVCAKLDQLQAEYLNRERIVEKLDRAEDPLRLRATRLLQFCASGLMTEGRSSEIARRRVLDHLRQPRFDERFVEGIADAEERQSTLREFYRLLKQAGLDEAVTTMMRNKA
ncbi:MAG: hypothetical protein K2Q10_09005, partial [Rhodospirillales bacterium]|nr:hypothetical protein [Rhodospirillales bacterium]